MGQNGALIGGLAVIDDQRPRMEARRLTQAATAAAAAAAEKIQMCDTNPDYPRRDVSAQAALTQGLS